MSLTSAIWGTSKLAQPDLNKHYKLPFKAIGDKYTGSVLDPNIGAIYYSIIFNGHDMYTTECFLNSGYGSPAWISPMITGLNVASTSIPSLYTSMSNRATLNASQVNDIINNGNFSSLGVSGVQITKEEESELRELEEECKSYVKNKKLQEFKKLPKNLRQRIVDILVLKTFSHDINSVDENSFEKVDRIKELRRKIPNSQYYNNNAYYGSQGAIYSTTANFSLEESTIMNIVNAFERDDLLKAHAEVSLEEELGD